MSYLFICTNGCADEPLLKWLLGIFKVDFVLHPYKLKFEISWKTKRRCFVACQLPKGAVAIS